MKSGDLQIRLLLYIGPWLSLVERLNGVQEVESSNLSGPIPLKSEGYKGFGFIEKNLPCHSLATFKALKNLFTALARGSILKFWFIFSTDRATFFKAF